jgi:hypothetical protein
MAQEFSLPLLQIGKDGTISDEQLVLLRKCCREHGVRIRRACSG